MTNPNPRHSFATVRIDADRAGQAQPDYADHYNIRAHGSHVKESDLDVLWSTDDACTLHL